MFNDVLFTISQTVRGRAITAIKDIAPNTNIINCFPIVAFRGKDMLPPRSFEKVYEPEFCKFCFLPFGTHNSNSCVCSVCVEQLGYETSKTMESLFRNPEYFKLASKHLDLNFIFPVIITILATRIVHEKLEFSSKSPVEELLELLQFRAETRLQIDQIEQMISNVRNVLYHVFPPHIHSTIDRVVHPQWFDRTFGVLMLNSFSCTNSISSLYSIGSFFNHSCNPNMHIEFYGACGIFTTSREILKGEELYISYADKKYFKSQEEMEQQLLSAYGFECSRSCTCGHYTPPKELETITQLEEKEPKIE